MVPQALPRDPSPVGDGGSVQNGINSRGGRGSSEEKELTPGQRRRKEQNRAAYAIPAPPPPFLHVQSG
jgi:hypothetical protein